MDAGIGKRFQFLAMRTSSWVSVTWWLASLRAGYSGQPVVSFASFSRQEKEFVVCLCNSSVLDVDPDYLVLTLAMWVKLLNSCALLSLAYSIEIQR